MALLTTQSIVKSPGAAPTLVAANAGGDTVTPGADFFYVNNGGGSPITVTITPNMTTTYGATLPAHAVTVAAGTSRFISLRDSSFVNTSTGLITISYSGVTTVTVNPFVV